MAGIPKVLGFPRAWLVIAAGADRQYAGNSGYDDDVTRAYRYDDFVQNHLQVAQGDVLVITDKKVILGVSRVLDIESSRSVKQRQLCPACGRSGLKVRSTRKPPLRCDHCKAEFETPRSSTEEAVCFVAHFQDAFERAVTEATPALFRACCPKYVGQLSIQPIELERLCELSVPVRAAVEKLLNLDLAKVLADVVAAPTANESELAWKVEKLKDLGPVTRPDGEVHPRRVFKRGKSLLFVIRR
jgi:ribosomal protein L37AE/L43A